MSFSDLKLFALSSNQELAQRVAQEIGLRETRLYFAVYQLASQ